MNANLQDVVPLPDNLSECGCRHAPRRHALDCATAIAFDATDIRDHPEYELGRRFAAISWDYPLRITAKVALDIQVDAVALIVAHYAEYADFEDYYGDDSDKPMAFIAHLIEDAFEFFGISSNRRVSSDYASVEDVEEYPAWTSADTDRVNAALARRVDPNQTTLI